MAATRTKNWKEQLFNFTLPGFHGYSLYKVFLYFIQQQASIRLFERAAAISFNLLLSIPPTLIFLATLVPFMPLGEFEQTLLEAIRMIAPNEELNSSIGEIVHDFLNTKQGELLSIGILSTIFFSSNGMMGIMRSFDRKSEGIKFRTGWNRRIKAIGLTVLMMIFVLIISAAIFFQSQAINLIFQYIPYQAFGVKLISYITIALVVYMMICIIYKYAPSLHKKFTFFSPGAAIATVAVLIVTYVFLYSATNFINYNKVYGSLGTLLMSMVLVNLMSVIILIGYEINLSIMQLDMNNVPRSIQKEKNAD